MRYFQKLDNLNIAPVAHSLARQPGLWNQDPTRTSFQGSPHKQVEDILLRFGNPNLQDLQAWDRPAMAKVTGAKALAMAVMYAMGGVQLGRVVITKLAPGGKVDPHPDEGPYAEFYTRYHVVLQGLPGSMFHCGDEAVQMQTGELWWFDSRTEHWVANNSREDRIHMIVDVRIDE